MNFINAPIPNRATRMISRIFRGRLDALFGISLINRHCFCTPVRTSHKARRAKRLKAQIFRVPGKPLRPEFDLFVSA